MDIAIIAPEGHYQQAEMLVALDTVLDLFVGRKALGLIMDLSNARGIEQFSVVRVRETAREIATKGAAYDWRLAFVTPDETAERVVRFGGILVEGQGVTHESFRSLPDARRWILRRAEAEHPPLSHGQ